jgi:thiol-disulfide isomerase/thioredoxin
MEIPPIPTARRAARGPGYLAVLLSAGWLASLARPAYAADVPVLDLPAYRGRVVVVDFWASWCKPCRQSIPWLNALNRRYAGQGLVIIGVNVDADRAEAERFLREVPVEFDVIYDRDGALAARFGVEAMPSSFVFDRSGQLAHRLLGFREARRDEHEARLRTLLGTPPR